MTFLANKRMHPALAARIEASVTGSKPARRGGARPRTIAIARVAVFVAIALFIYSVLTISSQRAQLRSGPQPATKPSAQK